MTVSRGLALGEVRRAVDIMEMHGVDLVLGHLLVARADLPALLDIIRPLIGAMLFDLGELPLGLFPFRVMPDHDEAARHLNMPARERGLSRHPLRVGHLDAIAIRTKAPSVEGALNGLALYAAALTEMRAEVGAERVKDGKLARFGLKKNEILAEIFERNDIAGLNLVVIGDLEPAVRDRRGIITVDAHDFLETRTCSSPCQVL